MDVSRAQRVEVEIDELVLHGFDATRRHAIGDAVVRELERLLAAGTNTAVRSTAVVDAGTIRVDPAGGAATGRGIARAIHNSLVDTGAQRTGRRP